MYCKKSNLKVIFNLLLIVSFHMAFGSMQAVNSQPTFTVSQEEVTIDEDAAPQIIENWATYTSAASGAPISTYTVSNVSDQSIFAVEPAVSTDGTLTFSSANDAYGTSTFMVTVTDTDGIDSETQEFTINIEAVNDPPLFTATPINAIDEDAGIQEITSWASFDPGAANESDQLVVEYIVTGITNPGLFAVTPSVSVEGVLTYTPADNANGTSDFTVAVQDNGSTANGGSDTSAPQTFTITINAVNDQPSFIASTPVSVKEDAGPVSITNWASFNPGAANESDQSATYLVTNISDQDFFASAPVVDGNGKLIFEVKPNLYGTVSFEVSVQDNGGTINGGIDVSDPQVFNIQVTPVNDKPSFSASNVTVDEDEGATVISNWATFNPGPNEDGQSPTYTVSNVLDPSLFSSLPVVNQNGDLSFTTADNKSGVTQFTVIVKDDGGIANGGIDTSDPGNFTFTISSVNDAPEFLSNPALEASEDQLYAYNLAFEDDLTEAGNLILTAPTLPAWLTLINYNDGTALLSGTPDNSHAGIEHDVVLSLEDESALQKEQSFKIMVNGFDDDPEFTSTATVTAEEDTEYSYLVTGTDEETSAANLTFTLTSGPAWLTLGANDGTGSATLSGIPSAEDIGTQSIVITLTDESANSAMQAFDLDVISVNDPPQITSTEITSAIEDDQYSYEITATDEETADGSLTFSLTTSATWLTLNPNDGTGKALLTGTPTQAEIGIHEITIKVKDGSNAEDIQNFSIEVASFNDLPVITSTASTVVEEGAEYAYTVMATDEETIPADLTFSLQVAPAWLEITNNSDGTALVSGTPGAEHVGSNAVTIEVSDGSKTQTQEYSINVIDVNNAPTFSSTPILEATEDVSYSYDVAATDDETTGEDLSFSLEGTPEWLSLSENTGGQVKLFGTPSQNNLGDNSVKIAVEDGDQNINYQEFVIKVAAVNDTPFFTSSEDVTASEDFIYEYTITASDEESSANGLTFSGEILPTWLSLTDNNNGTAKLSGTPSNSDLGEHDVTIRVTDQDEAFADQIFTITVTATNDAPKITSTAKTEAEEDVAYNYYITATDEDNAGSELTITAPVKPSWLTITDNGDGSANLAGTPKNNQTGSSSISIVVSDGNKTANQSFTLNVLPVNDPPVISSSPVLLATEDLLYKYQIKYSDQDNSNASLVLMAPTKPAWLTLTNNQDGTAVLEGTPNQPNVGNNNVTLTLSDGVLSVSQPFTINVSLNNDEPEFLSSPPVIVEEDQTYTYEIEIFDEEGSPLTLSATTKPDWLEFTPPAGTTKAKLSGIPDEEDIGFHDVRLELSDGAKTIIQSFSIEVLNVNDVPKFVGQPVKSVVINKLYTYNISTTDEDENDTRTISAPAKPSWLSLTDNGDGTAVLSGMAPGTESQSSVSLKVTDQAGASSFQNFSLSVVLENYAPVLDPSTIITDAVQGQPYSMIITSSDDDSNDSHEITAPIKPDWLVLTDNGDGSGVLQGTPLSTDVGEFDVRIIIADAANETDTLDFAITVENVNDSPDFISDPITKSTIGVSYSYAVNTADPDPEDTRTITAETLPDWLSLTDNGDGSGNITGTPSEAHLGENQVILIVEDVSGAANNQEFAITVKEPNSAPQFTSSAVMTANEGEFYQYEITTSDPDENDNLVIFATSIPAWLSFNNRGDGTAILSGTPGLEDVGEEQVSLRVEDNNDGVGTQNFTISVTRDNNAPEIVSTPATTVEEDVLYDYQILAEDQDADETLTFSVSELPTWMTFTDNQDGTARLRGTPANQDVSSYSIIVSVEDELGAMDEQNIDLTVINTNDPPKFTSTASLQAEVNNNYLYSIEVTDPDLGDQLTISAPELPVWLNLVDNGDGSGVLSGTPGAANQGENLVTLKVTDKSGLNDFEQFTIIVNTLPVVSSRSFNILEDSEASFSQDNFKNSFTDNDNDNLAMIKIISLPATGSLVHLGNLVEVGQEIEAASLNFLSYVPAPNFSGTDLFEWNGQDGKAYAATPASFTLNVSEVNDAPILSNIEPDPLNYKLKQDLDKFITSTITIQDLDDNLIQSARVFIQRNFEAGEDVLLFEDTDEITGSFNEEAGILNFTGEGSIEAYQDLLRSVKYQNIQVNNASLKIRTISFSVDDGETESEIVKRDLELLDEFVELDIPSGFTPDGDDINETWNIINIEAYPDCEIKIFSRTGQTIFQSDGYENEWDGTYGGRLLPADTYFYMIKLNDFGDIYKGTVTIIK